MPVPSSNTRKKITPKTPQRSDKYPYLFGCYIDEGYERELSRKHLQARVTIAHYKGTMLLRVLPERPRKGEQHECHCPSLAFPAAWLKGDDLDALIDVLREAKRTWLKAYRKAERQLKANVKADRKEHAARAARARKWARR